MKMLVEQMYKKKQGAQKNPLVICFQANLGIKPSFISRDPLHLQKFKCFSLLFRRQTSEERLRTKVSCSFCRLLKKASVQHRIRAVCLDMSSIHLERTNTATCGGVE